MHGLNTHRMLIFERDYLGEKERKLLHVELYEMIIASVILPFHMIQSVLSPGFGARRHETKRKDRQDLLKAKFCRRAMPVQHFVNPSKLVQAVSCTRKNTKNT